MSHPPTIDVPEEVFSYLNKLALQQGKTPETLAQELVSTAVQELEEDPLPRWAGAIDSEISDVADATTTTSVRPSIESFAGILMSDLFVDSSGWAAWLNRRELHHGLAVSIIVQARRVPSRLATTSLLE